MKKIFIDTNIICSPAVIEAIKNSNKKDNIFIIDEVLKEVTDVETEKSIKLLGIKVSEIDHIHLIKLIEIMSMSVFEDSTKLIDLFNNTGVADVLLLVHAIIERDNLPPILFPKDESLATEFIIATHDGGISDLAENLNIKTINQEQLLKFI